MVEERMIALDDYTIVNPLLSKMVWLDAPFVMTGLQKEECKMQEAWQAPRYLLEACSEELADLIRRSVVLYHAPAPFEMSPEVMANIFSGRNESWRVYRVEFTQDAGQIYFNLVLKAGMHRAERYQTARVGLGFFHVPEMTIRITEEINGWAAREVVYKRALGEGEAERRIVLAGWESEVGLEVLKVQIEDEEDCPTESSSRLTMYVPPEVCSGIEVKKL